MSKGGGSSTVDPYKAADAQLQANMQALKTSADINAVNQYAPWGSTTYTKNAEGVPTGQTITLGDAEQQNYDTTNSVKNALASQALTQSGSLGGAYTAPDTSRADTVAQALYDRKLSMLQPQFDEDAKNLELNLTERGIPIGSEIYNQEMDRLARNKSDALATLSQDATTAAGQESSRILADDMSVQNQNYNQLAALLSGASGGQMPTFQNTPAYNMSPVDVTSNLYSSASQNASQNSSFLNGLFGLGSSLLTAFSDPDLKENAIVVGETEGGLPIHEYNYKGDPRRHLGVMADEVERVKPGAVGRRGGYRTVNYAEIN